MYSSPTVVVRSYNINQQNAPLLNQYFSCYNVFYKFQTQGFTFRKMVVCKDCLHHCHVNKLYHTCMYSLLPADEPTGSKHVEDTIKITILV